MSTKYEDNFGFYCIDDDDPEELEFFCHIRAQSAPTICARCNQKVRLLEHIKICATCAEALEYGAPSDPAWVVPNLWSVVRRGVRS
jgi:predicted amidophosphoribosyltransferase